MFDDIVFMQHVMAGFALIQKVSAIEYQYNRRELVYQHDKLKLYHYQPKVKKPHAIPLLVVFATVNRPEILDLIPEQSFIRGLLDNEMDVYFLDWGYPEIKDKHIALSDYVTDYLQGSVAFIKEKTGLDQINLLGICQGGLMCLCYAALFADIKNLVVISAPVDFKTRDNTVGHLLKKIDVNVLTSFTGNVPGPWLSQFFISLRPFELVGKKYLRFVNNIENSEFTERFLQVEKWLQDAPDQTAASFKELAHDFYKNNKLIKGKIYFAGRKVDLGNIKIPILNVMASEDEIVPMSASKPLKDYVAATVYEEKIYPSGHIGIYVSDKVGKRMPADISTWLRLREQSNDG